MGKILFHILATELELIKTPTTNHLEECEFFANILNALVPLKAIFVGDVDVRVGLSGHPAGNDLRDHFVGDKADDDGNGERDYPKNKGNTPLNAVQGGDLESCTSYKDDHDLPSNHNNVYPNEKPIMRDTLKNVELVIETTVTAQKLAPFTSLHKVYKLTYTG